MSHFTVTVIVPKQEASSDAQIDSWVQKVMAPYQEADVWGAEGTHWDWYSVGGRWRGYFRARPGVELRVGDSGAGGNAPNVGGSDIIRKADVDWEGMVHDNIEKARRYYRTPDYDKFRVLIEGDGPKPTEDEYATSRASFATFALVDKNGEWHARGNMLMFGVVADESDPDAWGRAYADHVGGLDDDDVLVCLDAHV